MARSTVDPEIEKLLKDCGDLPGWSVTKTATGFKVTNESKQQVSIGRSAGGPNRLKNAIRSLDSIGFSPAKEKALAEKEAQRKQRIADDRAKVRIPAAAFVPPAPVAAVKLTPVPAPNGGKMIVVKDDEMWTETVAITPELAREMLDRPPAKLPDGRVVQQRPLDQNHVIWLAGVIERGEWELTPQGMSEAPDGGILDGQHRLSAIELAGKTVEVRITHNVPPQTFYAHDGGKKRSVANHLYTMGEANTNHLNSALKSLWCWEQWRAEPNGSMAMWGNWTRAKVSFPQTQDVLERWPEIRDCVKEGTNMMRAVKGIPGAAAVFLAVTSRAIDETYGNSAEGAYWRRKLQEFVEAVQTGEMIARGNPAYTLRNWILNGSGGSGPDKRERQLLALLKAWKATATGKEMRIVKFAPNESMILPHLPRGEYAAAA